MWILLYRFHKIYSYRKNLLDCTNLFYLDDYKKNDKIIYKYFKDKYIKFRVETKNVDETRNYLLGEIKHNDLFNKQKV